MQRCIRRDNDSNIGQCEAMFLTPIHYNLTQHTWKPLPIVGFKLTANMILNITRLGGSVIRFEEL